MAQQGAGYYEQQPYPMQPQGQSYPTPGPPPQNYQQTQQEQYDGKVYTQNPPMYGDNFVPPMDDKQTFQQTFKIDRPQYHDKWAGLLLIATFLGFVAVAGVSLWRYSRYHSFNGGGIYSGANDFSLNTNTLVLFVFVLVVAFVFSWAYFLAARAFTKQFVWLTGILNCLVSVGTAVYYLYRRLWSAGIIFTIFAIFAM